MAFLRFTRDKRGYEHFYLVEASTNRRGKTRARVLYWFRTPPGVRVGREPFDEEVRRTLEAQYPGITFDWRKINETPIPSAEAERWRERRRTERAEKAARRASLASAAAHVGASTEAADDEELDPDEAHEEAIAATEPGELIDSSEPLEPSELVEPAALIEAMDSLEPVEAGESDEPRELREPVEPGELRESVEPREPGEPVAPREPREPAEPRESRSHDRRRRRRRRRGRRPDSAPTAAVASSPTVNAQEPHAPAESDAPEPQEPSGE